MQRSEESKNPSSGLLMEKTAHLGMQMSQESKNQSSFGDKYEREKKYLSKTNLSTVYLAKEIKTGKTVILKQMQLHRGGNNNQKNIDVKRELELTEKVQSSGNKYLVKMIDAYQDKGNACLVLEYYPEGDLSKYLSKKPGNKLDEDQALSLFAKICEGYNWLAQNGIVHRDLKPLNIFMKDDDPIIGDFGKSRSYNPLSMTENGFTKEYMAPEQLLGDTNYGIGVDIWALGVILYEMVYGKYPFSNSNTGLSILNDNPSFSADLKRTNTLLQGMLEKDPNIRITWSQLYNHVLSYSDPQKLQDQISQLTDSASFYSLAVQILAKCQSLTVKKQPIKFLPQDNFLFIACSFVRVASLKLELALHYAELYKACTGEGLSSEKAKEINNLNLAIENFMNDEKWASEAKNKLKSINEQDNAKKNMINPLTIENYLKQAFKKDFLDIYKLVLQSAATFGMESEGYQQVVFQMINLVYDLLHDSSEVCKPKKNVALMRCIAQFHNISF